MSNMVKNSIFSHKVFNDIGNRQYKYVYFDGYWVDKENREHVAYENQQGVLDSEWKSAVRQTHVDVKSGIEKAKERLEMLKNKVEKTEHQLLSQMKYEKSYEGLSESEKIELWTRVFLFGSPDSTERLWNVNNEEDKRIAFALFINSKEFISYYRSSAIYSVLRSTNYGKAIGKEIIGGDTTGIRREFVEMLTETRTNRYKNFRNAVRDSMLDYFRDSGVTEDYINRQVTEAFSTTRAFIAEQDIQTNQKNYNWNSLYEKTKVKLKRSMEESLQKIKSKAKSQSEKNNDSKYDTWETEHLVDDVLDTLKVNMGTRDSPNIVMELTLEQKKEGGYKSTKEASAGAKRYSFLLAVRETRDILKGQSLSMGFIKNMKLEGTDFWNCIDVYMNNNLQRVVNSIFGENSKFFTQDWNASAMTGMLGELSTYVTHEQRLENLSLSGTTLDRITYSGKSLSLGESFRDLTFLFNGQKYGINVKRYVSKEKDSFTLYSDNEGIGINSQYMYRYFTPEEVNLIRFVALNRDFIVKNLSSATAAAANEMIINSYQEMSASHLDNFIRLSSATMESVNLFYVINNLTIPASVIYTYILNTLNNLEKAKSLFSILINNMPSAERINITNSVNIDDLPALVDKSNNLLKSSIKIKFKGLSLTGLGQIFK